MFLETVVEADIERVEMLHTLQRLVRQLNNLSQKLPSAFLRVGSCQDFVVITVCYGDHSTNVCV